LRDLAENTKVTVSIGVNRVTGKHPFERPLDVKYGPIGASDGADDQKVADSI
jgi:hypothetical protein